MSSAMMRGVLHDLELLGSAAGDVGGDDEDEQDTFSVGSVHSDA